MTNTSLETALLECAARGTPVTTLLQQAIDSAGAAGGGVVSIPPGRHRTGTLHLRSHVTLDLPSGAVLEGSGDLADYLPAPWPADGDRQRHHLLIADGAEGVTIRGGGTIDGNGPAFWQPQPDPRAWIMAREERVSPMIELRNCRDLAIEDVNILNSPGWTVHLLGCDRARIRGVRLINPMLGPNTDGFDINGCRDVTISDCLIETGDDCIVLKTSRDSRSCERITVTNCILRTLCAALKCGTESWHDFRQIVFANCVVQRSSRALALYCLDGCAIEDVAVNNIVCDTNTGLILNRPVHMDVRRRPARPGRPSADRVGRIANVTISNMIARTDGRLLLTAADGGELRNITLRDVQLIYPMIEDPAAVAGQCSSSQLSNATPQALAARAAVVAQGVSHLSVLNLQIAWPTAPVTDGQWHTGERRENGGFGVFPPIGPRSPVAFSVLWARDVTDGVIDSPLARASRTDVPAYDIRDCGAGFRPVLPQDAD